MVITSLSLKNPEGNGVTARFSGDRSRQVWLRRIMEARTLSKVREALEIALTIKAADEAFRREIQSLLDYANPAEKKPAKIASTHVEVGRTLSP